MGPQRNPSAKKELAASEKAIRPGGPLAGHFDRRADAVRNVAAAYRKAYGHDTDISRDTSPGTFELGSTAITPN